MDFIIGFYVRKEFRRPADLNTSFRELSAIFFFRALRRNRPECRQSRLPGDKELLLLLDSIR
jgi:hypothetical protein